MDERTAHNPSAREGSIAILVLGGIAIGSVALRMASKRMTTSRIQTDDYLILLATVR